jgi:hypothetical protein
MENKLNIVDQLFGLITKVSEWLDKFGVKKLLRTAFAIFALYWMCIFMFNPSKIFEAYQAWYDKVHSEKIEKTIESHYQIHGHLTDLRYRSSAMRAMILSLHNGSANINGQYQFLKVSAIFEECGDYYSVSDEWNEVHISNFPIFSYLYSNDYYCGSLDSLRDIDKKLYHRLAANDVGYIHIESLIGDNDQTIGFLVLTWEEEPEDHLSLHNEIYKTSSRISRLME